MTLFRAQKILQDLGHTVDLDGSQSQLTIAALREFQRMSGLTPTGVLDLRTMDALERAEERSVPFQGPHPDAADEEPEATSKRSMSILYVAASSLLSIAVGVLIGKTWGESQSASSTSRKRRKR